MEQLRFSIPEILMLIGTAQCIYILVYMIFRSGRISRAGLPLLYFFVLGLAFLSDFAEGYIGEITQYYFYIQWVMWFLGPPLSVLLVVQIAQIHRAPALKYYWVLALIPAAFIIAQIMVTGNQECANLIPCAQVRDWLALFGFIAGCVSLLAIWMDRDLSFSISRKNTGKERYWLILALVFTNIFFLTAVLVGMGAHIGENDLVLIRTVLGLGFVYLVGTSLFRIYPQAVQIVSVNNAGNQLSPGDRAIAEKIENLFKFEKIYHEANYSRTDMARECNTSEAVVSKVINIYFKKSFPQLISEHRVEDSKRMLLETNEHVSVISSEVGFNSLASFNRVFKEMTGVPPGEYRKNARK